MYYKLMTLLVWVALASSVLAVIEEPQDHQVEEEAAKQYYGLYPALYPYARGMRDDGYPSAVYPAASVAAPSYASPFYGYYRIHGVYPPWHQYGLTAFNQVRGYPAAPVAEVKNVAYPYVGNYPHEYGAFVAVPYVAAAPAAASAKA